MFLRRSEILTWFKKRAERIGLVQWHCCVQLPRYLQKPDHQNSDLSALGCKHIQHFIYSQGWWWHGGQCEEDNFASSQQNKSRQWNYPGGLRSRGSSWQKYDVKILRQFPWLPIQSLAAILFWNWLRDFKSCCTSSSPAGKRDETLSLGGCFDGFISQ